MPRQEVHDERILKKKRLLATSINRLKFSRKKEVANEVQNVSTRKTKIKK